MEIWIDVNTPKQALFLTPLVEELDKRGHGTHVTSRHYREAEGLLRKSRFEVTFVGKHGGASLLDKLIASNERIRGLADVVPGWSPGLAVHFASPECARVAFGLRIPQVCISDCPHTVSVDRLTLPLVDRLVTPRVIPYEAWKTYGVQRKTITRYDALDPAVWLKRRNIEKLNIEELGADPNRRTITVRYEESYASYLLDKDASWGIDILDALTSNFGEYNILVLGRYEQQLSHLAEKFGNKIILPKETIDGAALLKATDLFVGMGGTMTVEAALLGIPSISAYQGGHLYYISYLVKQGLTYEAHSINRLVESAKELLASETKRKLLAERSRNILEKMEDPIEKIMTVLEQFWKS